MKFFITLLVIVAFVFSSNFLVNHYQNKTSQAEENKETYFHYNEERGYRINSLEFLNMENLFFEEDGVLKTNDIKIDFVVEVFEMDDAINSIFITSLYLTDGETTIELSIMNSGSRTTQTGNPLISNWYYWIEWTTEDLEEAQRLIDNGAEFVFEHRYDIY